MPNSTALNLEAICKGIDAHNGSCDSPATEVKLCFYEYQRLDFPEIKGIPLKVDETMQSGRFRVVCAKGHGSSPSEVEAAELVA